MAKFREGEIVTVDGHTAEYFGPRRGMRNMHSVYMKAGPKANTWVVVHVSSISKNK